MQCTGSKFYVTSREESVSQGTGSGMQNTREASGAGGLSMSKAYLGRH